MTESNNPALTQTPVESIPIPAIVPENLPSPAETPINEPATDPIPTQPKKRSWKKIIILALILASIVLFPVPVRG
ncbi:MAG: hypothetical protein Q8Q24_02425, partial [bacterium]|nr:hypothetical protein [bacterium]